MSGKIPRGNECSIQQHLQSMFCLLRKEETLKMAVKLETARSGRTRYLVVVSRPASCRTIDNQSVNAQSNDLYTLSNVSGSISKCNDSSSGGGGGGNCKKQISEYTKSSRKSQNENLQNCDINTIENIVYNENKIKCDLLTTSNIKNNNCNDVEESCLLGIDCNEKTTVGLVLRILADTAIRLDGDGGFSVSVYGRTHIFKPVSVQAMWSALQTLHKVSAKARANNYYPGGPSHDWVSYYEDRIESEQSCLNEWHTMDSIESRRPPSPDAIRNKPTEREETERVIRTALKEIMMSVDLDEVTSKYIRSRLEEHLDMDLGEFKSFIDQEMLIILGQMDAPTEVFDHVYLGSEWNASNLEELQRNGVHHILNVTREIDNFFPGMFDYFNVRVYDDEKTNLLKHWDNTFKYITRAKKEGSKVLVHCKMGVSRSASVVIAYAMKAYNWNFHQALKHVKKKRNCIKPNKSFLTQLETYQGMLDAMKNKEKLQRSKSETNLRSVKDARLLPGSEPTPLIQALNAAEKQQMTISEKELKKFSRRPKSWSPDHVEVLILLPKQQSQSLENLTPERKKERTKNVRLPCSNGQNYSVSQNQVVHLQENSSTAVPSSSLSSSVKLIVSELESNQEKLHANRSKSCTNQQQQQQQIESSLSSSTIKKKTWDPGVLNTYSEELGILSCNSQNLDKNSKIICDSPTWTSSAQIIHRTSINETTKKQVTSQKDGDSFSSQVDRVFEREEKKIHHSKIVLANLSQPSPPPPQQSVQSINELSQADQLVSRQSSWSSVDSAVVLRDTPSRHSSWGSGDSRALPSRNSSWGSYDIKHVNPNQSSIGTIKRTKYRFDHHAMAGKKFCTPMETTTIVTTPNTKQNRAIDLTSLSAAKRQFLFPKPVRMRSNSEEILYDDKTILALNSRLSASAPETSSIGEKCFQTNRHSKLLPTEFPHKSRIEETCTSIMHNDPLFYENLNGIVHNLKMNFEANMDTRRDSVIKVCSLPSSPIAAHTDKKYEQFIAANTTSAKSPSEEINVRGLVDKYEISRIKGGGSGCIVGKSLSPSSSSSASSSSSTSSSVTTTTTGGTSFTIRPRPRSVFETKQQPSAFSKPLMINHSTIVQKIDDFRRPPVPPPTVKNQPSATIPIASVLVTKTTTCKRVQQHGKTHPLSRLGLPKQRINTAAYNTM